MTEPDDPTLDARRSLHAINHLHACLPRQAFNHASARLMPGGLAMVALGPVASVEAWDNQRDTIERQALDEEPNHGVSGYLDWETDTWVEYKRQSNIPPCDDSDDWEPPLQTLRYWSEAWRVEWGREVDAWTVQTEVVFLLGALNWAHKYDHDRWDDFCRDIRAAVRRLEDVLHDGEREERSWVPCLDCETGRDGQPIAIRLVRVYARTQDEDRWECPRCRRKYDDAGYQLAQGEALRKHTEETMTA